MIDFSAVWCAPCQRLKRTTLSDPSVSAALGKVLLVEVDLDKHPALGQHYGVSAIPDVLFLDEGGKLVDRLRGFEPPGPFLERLTRLIRTSSKGSIERSER